MNLKDKLHDKVYVVVSVEKELPENCDDTFVELNKGDKGIAEHLEKGEWEGYGMLNKGNITNWLKLTEQSYVLSPSELLELKKKWMQKAFEAGELHEYSRIEEHIRGKKNEFLNKTDYINSITL